MICELFIIRSILIVPLVIKEIDLNKQVTDVNMVNKIY